MVEVEGMCHEFTFGEKLLPNPSSCTGEVVGRSLHVPSLTTELESKINLNRINRAKKMESSKK